jgi:glycyl-tRNA synthetase (class II)
MDIAKALNEERTKLNTQLEELAKKKEDIDAQMQQVKTELKAIDAYEQSKNPAKKEKKTRAPRKTGVKQAVMNLIASSAGITRAKLIEMMQAQDDKAKQQQISNVLTALKKAGTVSAVDGTYTKV